eukprot:2923433-Pyramimonas_sp.AAC.1
MTDKKNVPARCTPRLEIYQYFHPFWMVTVTCTLYSLDCSWLQSSSSPGPSSNRNPTANTEPNRKYGTKPNGTP